jgi:hypothetical protein
VKRILGALALGLVVLPAGAVDAPPGCAWLCGNWIVDAALSESAEPLVDAALSNYKEPRPRNSPRQPAGFAAGPIPEQSVKTALRDQLLQDLAPPASLVFGEQADAILIRAASGEVRRAYPGEPHSRITSQGTMKISTEWKKDALIVKETINGQSTTTETYALLPEGTLQLTRVMARPGMKALRLRAMYRRGQTQALESGPQERATDNAP